MNETQFRTGAQGGFLPAVRMGAGAHQPQYAPAVARGNQTFAGRAYGTPAFMGQVRLGQTAETWYKRARAALDRFRFLKNQVATIDNKVERDSIVAWLGGPNVVDSPEYRYAAVLQDYTFDASVENEGIEAYAVGRRQSRVEKLEQYNDDLNAKIESARVTYGSRPVTPGAPAPVAAGPDLTLPIVGVGLLIAAAVVLG